MTELYTRPLGHRGIFLATLSSLCLASFPALTAEPLSSSRALGSCSDFASPEEIVETLEGLAQAHPDICRTTELGASVQGRPIIALLVGQDLENSTDAVFLRVLGALHGNECISAQTALDLAQWLVENAETDPLAAGWILDAVTAFVPLTNPDGYSAMPATRHNAAGADINRDLPVARLASDGPAFSQPETRAIRDLNELGPFHIGVELHTVENYLNGPWNHTPHRPPDEELLLELMERYAGNSGYSPTFGWDWYDIYGDMNDWSYGASGTMDFAVELRSDVALELAVHGLGLLSLIEAAKTAIVGVVRDAKTEMPVLARIDLTPEGAPVFTSPKTGAYRRIVLPGQYQVRVSSPGYYDMKATTTVTEGSEAILDFDLEAQEDSPTWGFALEGTVLPHAVPRLLNDSTYLDDSSVFDLLGPADGVGYSLKPRGELTVDLGRRIAPSGRRLALHSSSGSDDRVSVSVAQSEDGPYLYLGEGTGDFELSLDDCPLAEFRYVRLTDLTNGPFNAPEPGYDLDAIAVMPVSKSQDDIRDEPVSLPPRAISGASCQYSAGASATPFLSSVAWLTILLL